MGVQVPSGHQNDIPDFSDGYFCCEENINPHLRIEMRGTQPSNPTSEKRDAGHPTWRPNSGVAAFDGSGGEWRCVSGLVPDGEDGGNVTEEDAGHLAPLVHLRHSG